MNFVCGEEEKVALTSEAGKAETASVLENFTLGPRELYR